MRPRRLRRLLTAAGFGAIITGTVLGTGLAKADTADDAFLAVLDDQGITYPSPEYIINAGHSVCNARAQGYSEFQIAQFVDSAANLSAYNAGFFVGAAEGAYCPQYYLNGTV